MADTDPAEPPRRRPTFLSAIGAAGRALRKIVPTVTDATGRKYVDEDFVRQRDAKGATSHGEPDSIKSPGFSNGLFMIEDWGDDTQPAKITESLYVGSMDAAEHIENLTAAGITHILNLASIPNRFPQHFTYRDIELDDDPDAALEDILPMALSFIRDALAQNGVVFVHCMAGVSRSVSVCIAYLLLSGQETSYDAAMARIREVRPQACPNPGFARLLRRLSPSSDYHCKRSPLWRSSTASQTGKA